MGTSAVSVNDGLVPLLEILNKIGGSSVALPTNRPLKS